MAEPTGDRRLDRQVIQILQDLAASSRVGVITRFSRHTSESAPSLVQNGEQKHGGKLALGLSSRIKHIPPPPRRGRGELRPPGWSGAGNPRHLIIPSRRR